MKKEEDVNRAAVTARFANSIKSVNSFEPSCLLFGWLDGLSAGRFFGWFGEKLHLKFSKFNPRLYGSNGLRI